ncbi:MAG: CHAT domain-containing protein, partial [Halobacteriota archaeon]|nr:CHAT domain-containing protein [Halobacteriota archaeon]
MHVNSKVLDIAIRPKTDDAESFVVIIDGVRTRDVIDEDARNIRKAAETDERSLSYDEALGLGSRLLKSIESENNEIAERIGACVQKGLPLVLLFSITYEIESLPIELLSSDGRFLALDKYLTIARKVESSHIRPLPKSDKGRLSCVFMATSPEDLDPADVLQFEKEEDILAKISLSYPIDLIIDDSGGLQGLKNSVYKAKRMTPADDCDTLDVLHISGHARAEGLADPVFLMEDLYGQSVSVTARELWNAIKLNHPKVIFLSGCQTAMSGTVASHGSFAKQIVREGVPFAIAWGQSVFDDDAMQAAYEFYGALASGMSLHGAVQMARISLRERLHAWPILRLYVERGEDFTFVNAHKKMVDHIPNKVIYSHFEHGRVRYLQEGFVGRRREIQFALNQINRTPQSKILWIHGPKGLGKSCLACRIIERVEEDYRDRVLVFSGALNAEALFPRLMDHFDRLGDNDAIEILSSLISVAEKVKKLFREVFSKHSYLFLFDDFEVNMEIESEKNRLKEGSHQIIADFLRCLSWCDNRTFCIVTSTLGKDEESEWADLVSSITLSSFKPEELNKLLLNGNFEHVVRSGNSEVYLTLSKGNPRLLEIFEHVARREDRFSIEDLKARLIGKTNEFIVEQLSQLLTEDSAPHFQEYCQRISVLGLPLHSEAFQHFGPLGLLKDAVNRGIIESYRTGTGEPIYWVNVLLREA